MRELELKFNSGAGALLCPSCRCTIAYGFEHDSKTYVCKNCKKVTIVVEDSGKLIGLGDADIPTRT